MIERHRLHYHALSNNSEIPFVALDLVEEHLKAVFDLYDRRPFHAKEDHPVGGATAFFFLVRVSKTLKAFHLLGHAGQGFEAMAILRPSYEYYLSLLWLLERDTETRARCWIDHAQIMQSRAAREFPHSADEQVRDRQSDWDAATNRFKTLCGDPKKNHFSGKTIKDLASYLDNSSKWKNMFQDSYSISDIYGLIWRLTSQYMHASGWTWPAGQKGPTVLQDFLKSDTYWIDAGIHISWSLNVESLRVVKDWCMPEWEEVVEEEAARLNEYIKMQKT